MEINFKAGIKTSKILSPKHLLETVQKKGYFPNYSHDLSNDKVLCELKFLADKYRQSLSIDDKQNLIHHEINMLYEELEHPELTLARNYSEIKSMYFEKKDKKNILNFLDLFNANALRRIEFLQEPFENILTLDKIKILEGFLERISSNKLAFEITKTNISDIYQTFLAAKTDIDSEDVEFIEEFEDFDIDIKTREPEVLHEFLVDSELDKTLVEDAKALILDILSDKDASPEALHYAVWGGGKYRNDEIFEQLKNIVFDKNEEDIRKQEFALHSISKYAREKYNEVDSIMDKLSDDEDFVLNSLAIIIYNKLHGEHYGEEDREISCWNHEEKADFKKWRDLFVNSKEELSPRKINAIDRGLMPFRNVIAKFVKNLGRQVYILGDDSYTKIRPNKAGERSFAMGANSGAFYDSFYDINNELDTVISRDVESKYQHNAIAHECAHLLQKFLPPEIQIEIEKLYQKALEENRCLDDYAATNSQEYFAQGLEAYVSVYKPHRFLMDNNGWDNTLYKLIYKDPGLYELINYLDENMA